MSKLIILFTLLILPIFLARAQETFLPPETRLTVSGQKVNSPIQIDGRLDEVKWQSAQTITAFTQRDPNQSEPASFETHVRILYDDQFLYIGATCFDDFSKKSNLRVLNMQRDFDPYQNDKFGVAIDGFLDGQNSNGFEVTP